MFLSGRRNFYLNILLFCFSFSRCASVSKQLLQHPVVYLKVFEKVNSRQIIALDFNTKTIDNIDKGKILRGTEVVDHCFKLLRALPLFPRRYRLTDASQIQLRIKQGSKFEERYTNLSPLLSIASDEGQSFYARVGGRPIMGFNEDVVSAEKERGNAITYFSALEKVRQITVEELKTTFEHEPKYHAVIQQVHQAYLQYLQADLPPEFQEEVEINRL